MVCFWCIQMCSHQCRQTFYPIHSKKEPHKSSMSCHQLFPLIGIQFSSGKKRSTSATRITGPWPKKSNIASIHCTSTLRQILNRLFQMWYQLPLTWVSQWGSTSTKALHNMILIYWFGDKAKCVNTFCLKNCICLIVSACHYSLPTLSAAMLAHCGYHRYWLNQGRQSAVRW